jgi:hypothetical protein
MVLTSREGVRENRVLGRIFGPEVEKNYIMRSSVI